LKNTQGVKYLPYHSLTWVGEVTMLKHFTLEYWKDSGWYFGKLKEVPGVFYSVRASPYMNWKRIYEMLTI